MSNFGTAFNIHELNWIYSFFSLGYTIMPPKKKSKRGSFSPQPGLSHQYLMEHFTAVPANHEELKNGHVLLSFISNDHSWTNVIMI